MMKHALPLSTLAVWFVATSVLLAQTAPTTKSSDLGARHRAATVSDTTTNGRQPSLIVLTTFPGDSGPGPKDNPDNTGGVGPDHVVDFTNMNVVIHDKQTGKAIKHVTQTEFWKNVTPGFRTANAQ